MKEETIKVTFKKLFEKRNDNRWRQDFPKHGQQRLLLSSDFLAQKNKEICAKINQLSHQSMEKMLKMWSKIFFRIYFLGKKTTKHQNNKCLIKKSKFCQLNILASRDLRHAN